MSCIHQISHDKKWSGHAWATCLALAVTFAAATFPAAAEDAALKAGMQAFNAGNYSEAAGHFGQALSTEFNNSVLHYYLGNCYVHMKQRESAVREFRIAYALDPEKEVGKYAKQALSGLNADAGGAGVASSAVPPNAAADAVAKAAVSKLLELKNKPGGMTTVTSKTPTGTTAAASGSVPPVTSGKPIIEIGPGGKIVEKPPMPVPAMIPISTDMSKIEALKKLYEANRSAPAARMNSELQRTAENLRELLNEQAKPGAHHIVPAGTNVYIRNYETAPNQATKPTSTTTKTGK